MNLQDLPSSEESLRKEASIAVSYAIPMISVRIVWGEKNGPCQKGSLDRVLVGFGG
jgi:hypothetical protein